MSHAESPSDLSIARRVAVPFRRTTARRPTAPFFVACLLLTAAASLQAYPINYNVSGNLGAVTNGGPDPFGLAGKTFSLSGNIDSSNSGNASLQLTVGGLAINLQAPVTFTPGSPGSISLS